MSNEFAIATVTEALGQRVYASAKQAVNGAGIRYGRPAAPGESEAKFFANVYLYQTTPHAALRNADLPTRDSDGSLTQRPRAAIELHYLISFYGDETKHEPDRMLAATVRDLHSRPVLTPQDIANVTGQGSGLVGSDLAVAPERVRFTPVTLSLDDLSRLWSVMVQTPYALSLVYSASVVLLDAREITAPAPPVLQRGKGDSGPDAGASVTSTFPSLDSSYVEFLGAPERRPPLPSLRAPQLGTQLTITGRNLGGDKVTLRLTHPLKGQRDIVIDPADRDDRQIRLALNDDDQAATDWAAGLYGVVAEVKRGDKSPATSPTWPLMLAPHIRGITPKTAVRVDKAVTLRVTCSPAVLTDQRVTLLVREREIAAAPRAQMTATVEFLIANAPALTDELVWLRVDGAESLPVRLNAGTGLFEFDPKQQVTIE